MIASFIAMLDNQDEANMAASASRHVSSISKQSQNQSMFVPLHCMILYDARRALNAIFDFCHLHYIQYVRSCIVPRQLHQYLAPVITSSYTLHRYLALKNFFLTEYFKDKLLQLIL